MAIVSHPLTLSPLPFPPYCSSPKLTSSSSNESPFIRVNGYMRRDIFMSSLSFFFFSSLQCSFCSHLSSISLQSLHHHNILFIPFLSSFHPVSTSHFLSVHCPLSSICTFSLFHPSESSFLCLSKMFMDPL